MPHSFTDAVGAEQQLPELGWRVRCRLKDWGVCNLDDLLGEPQSRAAFFGRLKHDAEFAVNLAYALLHDEPGSEEQQTAFAESLFGQGQGSGPLQRCRDALMETVIDFFPEADRESIRLLMTLADLETLSQALSQDSLSEPSDSETLTNGSNGCSESSDGQESPESADSASEPSASVSTESPITT